MSGLSNYPPGVSDNTFGAPWNQPEPDCRACVVCGSEAFGVEDVEEPDDDSPGMVTFEPEHACQWCAEPMCEDCVKVRRDGPDDGCCCDVCGEEFAEDFYRRNAANKEKTSAEKN